MGLVLVPTPLGNLRDITLRALDVLRDCDLIAAEDTRVARRLLAALELPMKPIVSYREQNAAAVTAAILEQARAGSVALMSDAGTPGLSDPGRGLVVAARAANIPVTVLPGPVAFVCAAVLSGFDLTGLCFDGFVPRVAGARRAALANALSRAGPTAWYESPHRIAVTLEALEELAIDTRVFVARELTKLYEQQLLGTPREVRDALPDPVRGEIVLIVAPPPERPRSSDIADIDREIDALLDEGMPAPAVAKVVAAGTGAPRGPTYDRVVDRQRRRKEDRG